MKLMRGKQLVSDNVTIEQTALGCDIICDHMMLGDTKDNFVLLDGKVEIPVLNTKIKDIEFRGLTVALVYVGVL